MEEQERTTVVNLYLEKSDLFWREAEASRELRHWPMTANRMYHALLNAVRALLVNDSHPAHTHDGVKSLFGQYYVLTGEVSREQARLFSQMETLRNRSDYDCYFKATEDMISTYFEPVKELISRIKSIIESRKDN